MKKYDNFFVPVDNIEVAKKYYEDNLGLKVKFDFSDMGMIAFSVDGEEAAIILKDKNKTAKAINANYMHCSLHRQTALAAPPCRQPADETPNTNKGTLSNAAFP